MGVGRRSAGCGAVSPDSPEWRAWRARTSLDLWASRTAPLWARQRAERVREDLEGVRRLLSLWAGERAGLEWSTDARGAGRELDVLAEETADYETLWLQMATTPVAGETLRLIALAENLPRVRRRAYSILYELGLTDASERPPEGGLGRAGAERVLRRRKKDQAAKQQG